jgi:hypothetical protein
MMPNHLFIKRLFIVTDEGKVAYDERFHKGVNIIRGDNSSGKSTITHFIFFVLGGAFNDFVPEARKCSKVYAEVEMNQTIFTIRRDIETNDDGVINTQSPLYFFWGDMTESFNPQPDKNWQKFGYRTLENKKSFSNVLFETLGLPTVKADSNITFHQILRLLYVDQDSPTSSLFYYEYFDSQLTRETVSDLLLGVYNEELYDKKKRLISAEKELDEIKSEIRATGRFFADPLSLNPGHLETVIRNKEQEIANLQQDIVAIRMKTKDVNYDDDSKLSFQSLNEEAISKRQLVAELENEIVFLSNEIEDSDFFISTLNKKLKALKDSVDTRSFLGRLPLEYCPECLTELKSTDHQERCKLCKEPIDGSFGVVQAKRMQLEIGFQISESSRLLEINKRLLMEAEAKYGAESGKLQDIQKQVNIALEDVRSFTDETLDKLNSDKGFLEGEILQYRTMLENALLYDKLLSNKGALEKEIGYLKGFIFMTEKEQKLLKTEINQKVKEEGVYLLNNDLDRQDDFKNANDFTIDYANNIAFLSNKFSKYSASSNFYLKVSARFAIFLASLSIDRMRYPRFIFADNMEDKGIEQKRAQNFQELLIKRVSNFSQDGFQMIYTTSYITPELNESDYVVGEYYTKASPSLKNIRKD